MTDRLTDVNDKDRLGTLCLLVFSCFLHIGESTEALEKVQRFFSKDTVTEVSRKKRTAKLLCTTFKEACHSAYSCKSHSLLCGETILVDFHNTLQGYGFVVAARENGRGRLARGLRLEL
jgi:hypothetical protein